MPQRPPAQLLHARFSIAVGFLTHAMISGTWGPRLPAIKADVGLTNGELGIALFGMATGLLAGTRLAGRPVDRFGSRLLIRAGLPTMCAALVAPAFARNLPLLTVTFLLLGAVAGFLDVAINVHAVVVQQRYGRPILSGLHGLWSVGGLAGATVAAAAAGAGVGPRLHFGVVALVLGVGSVAATSRLLPAAAKASTGASAGAGRAGPGLWSPAVVLLGLIAFCSFLGEGSANDWSAVYLHEELHAGAGFAAMGFAAFSATMAATRFASDRITARLGPVAVVRAGGLIAGTGLILGIAVRQPGIALLGFALLGAGLAPVVPVAFTAAGNLGGAHMGSVIGRVTTIGYVGSIVGPLLIGFLAEGPGLRAAMLLPAALALAIAAAAGRVAPAAVRTL
jgi:MFS family permease